MTASVPELTMRTISREGKASRTMVASVISASVEAPYEVPSFAARVTAATTCGCACPAIIGPHEQT